MTVQQIIAEAIEDELSLGGDPKSAASNVMSMLADHGYTFVRPVTAEEEAANVW